MDKELFALSKKIAVLVTDHFEDSEYAEPVQSFKEKGHEITAIEMEKGKKVKGKQGQSEVVIDETIDNVSPDDFDDFSFQVDFHRIYFVQTSVLFASPKHLWMLKNLC